MSKKEKITIIHQDASIIACFKPSGMLVIPDRYDKSIPTVTARLAPEWGKLWIVHRIDRDTSGVLLLARNSSAHRSLNDQFAAGKVNKVYHAVVSGSPSWDELSVDEPLTVDGDNRHRTRVSKQGREAVTRFKVLEKSKQYAWLEAVPLTGRTHQIRAHLAYLGYPALCDFLYGDGKPFYLSSVKARYKKGSEEEKPLIRRPALHALSLEFRHPANRKKMKLAATYPRDFKAVLRQLFGFVPGR